MKIGGTVTRRQVALLQSKRLDPIATRGALARNLPCIDIDHVNAAPDYLVIGGDGNVETRTERLAWLRWSAELTSRVAAQVERTRWRGAAASLGVRAAGFTAEVTGGYERCTAAHCSDHS